MMRIYYRLLGEGAEIVRCYGNDSKIILPVDVGGVPVVRVASYAFSDKKEGEDYDTLVYETAAPGLFSRELSLLAGALVKEIVFPATVREIGNYIFYGCKNLRKLEFSDCLTQIGSGAFTGCGVLGYLNIHMKKGNQSCVKEILGDLWQRIDVTFFYGDEKAKLVFPEHYEEAVENTPARILYTQHHGSGNNYRQCFYNKEMDYEKYDSLFSVAAAWDKPSVLADLALNRLAYPHELSEICRQAYEGLLKERYCDILEYLIQKEKFAKLRLFADIKLWTPEMMEFALECAARTGKTEILGYLMNEKQQILPFKKKSFEL